MRRYLVSAGVFFTSLILAGSEAAQDSLSDDLQFFSDLTTRPLAQRALRWECSPSVRYVCTAEGCERKPSLVSVRLDLAEKTYARCDNKGCDSYPMTFSTGGIFTTVSLPASGSAFLKIVNDGSQYIEVASVGLAVHQNFGACKPSR